jgi:RNA polymerase sigma factor (sigma-70 family)
MSTVKASDVIIEPLEQEFEDIFRDHHDMVFRTAYGVLGNSSDAEDVVQNIFLRLLDRGISPDATRNPAGYLYKAAVNESLNLIRSRKRLTLVGEADGLAADLRRTLPHRPKRSTNACMTPSRNSARVRRTSWFCATCTSTAMPRSRRSLERRGARSP